MNIKMLLKLFKEGKKKKDKEDQIPIQLHAGIIYHAIISSSSLLLLILYLLLFLSYIVVVWTGMKANSCMVGMKCINKSGWLYTVLCEIVITKV